MARIFGEFVLVYVLATNRSTKTPQTIRGQFRQNSGRKFEEFGELSFCKFSDLRVCVDGAFQNGGFRDLWGNQILPPF